MLPLTMPFSYIEYELLWGNLNCLPYLLHEVTSGKVITNLKPPAMASAFSYARRKKPTKLFFQIQIISTLKGSFSMLLPSLTFIYILHISVFSKEKLKKKNIIPPSLDLKLYIFFVCVFFLTIDGIADLINLNIFFYILFLIVVLFSI